MTSTNDTPNEGVITSYAQAPARTITAGGVTYAYRELGPKGGTDIRSEEHTSELQSP